MSLDPKYYGLIEMGLMFGIVAVFTIQQLWSLRDKPPKDDGPPTPPEPLADQHGTDED
jgi:hypothetical protein